MTAEPALVDDVRSIRREQPTLGRARRKREHPPIRVRFAGGAEARLNPNSPRDRTWAEVLDSLRDSRQPAYVEIDPETRYITSLLLPQTFYISAIHETPQGDLEVELEISHARHFLRRDHARFNELKTLLERARREKTPVLVTESLDSTAIVDVRPRTREREGPP
jgi:hypothetical protein